MKRFFSALSFLVLAAILLSASTLFAKPGQRQGDSRQDGKSIAKMVKVELPCVVKATQMGNTNKYDVRLVATNTTGSWLQEGKKVNYTYGPAMKGTATLGIMVPDSGQVTLKRFLYTADPYAPTAVGCTAYFMKVVQ